MDEVKIREELEFARFARDVFESLGSFVAIDDSGKLIYAGKDWADFLNIDRDQAIGRPLTDVLTNTMMDDLLARSRDANFILPESYFIPNGGNIRRRLVVYKDGKPSKDRVSGAVSFNILDSAHGQASQNELLDAISSFLLRDKMDMEQLSEICSAEGDPDDILGVSPITVSMKSLIQKVAPSSVSVCILGETGTGKELVANAIHKLSKRADKPFVKINCAAIPKDLMESELFGYEPGAFTGASRQGKLGKFELANGGTLLLDEIGEMTVSLQAKLLRVLQSQEVERVGGTKAIPIDVRLLCSTNRNLSQMVEEGKFRADLYYRINTMEIRVPSLRERKGDIPALVSHFIQASNERNALSVSGISKRAAALLRTYHWPGNVRELENAIERACVLCGSGILDISHFSTPFSAPPFHPTQSVLLPQTEFIPMPHPLPRRLRNEDAERRLIAETLDLCMGNRTAAAKRLGISRTTLYEKIKRYGIG